ncbi:MAG: chemotaxis protein CheA, partial [Syntrophomonadaceae bacterium]|nr:chemotaxis protein CheA [Syntrophomonadaceae bacterium]
MLKNEEYIQSFLEEAKIHVESVENGLVNMNLDDIDAEQINTIFRAVHSMKGSAGFFNLEKIVGLSHCMENLFGEIRNQKVNLSSDMVDILLAANDCLKKMVDDVLVSEDVDISDYVESISGFLKSSDKSPSSPSDTAKKPPASSHEIDCSVTSIKNELLADAIRHGHTYYLLKAGFNEDFVKKSTNPIELIQTIKSIGEFIDLKAALSEPADHEEASVPDIILEFYFTSVLQKDFLTDALDIPEENIAELIFELEPESEITGHADEAINEPLQKLDSPGAGEKEKPREIGNRKSQALAAEDSIRVHVSLLNDLLNLASEMVLGRNQLLRTMEGHRKSIAGIDPVLQNIDHITTELQEKVMQTRMQPISNVFNKFPRIIRELARKLGKEMELKLEGSEVELDKSIIEAIGDPLTHLIRNAADHGLETSDIREKLGKPRKGTVLMKAYHEGGYVNIDVIDDGAGIDIERIKDKALEKGLIHNSDLAMMGDQEILQLLFKPGFSTADKVTDVSGRGVGMDVVKTNIEQLGGTIEIFSAVSQGTTFRLLLPLTLAIIPSLIVQVENQRFALPQVNLQEIVRIKPGQLTRKIEFINNSEVLRLRGGLLPIVHLGNVLGLPRTYIDPVTKQKKEDKRVTIFGYCKQKNEADNLLQEDETVFHMRNINKVIRILVIKIGSRKLGIAVDAIHGSEEILVKPLSSFINDCRCYSGVTIMGDGKTALILDPEGIIVKANLRFNDGNTEKPEINPEEEIYNNIGEQQNLLLFKCSGPETMAIDLFMVSRVEEIESGDIERIGDKEYIKFRQDSLRVIRPEDYLPISKDNSSSNQKLYIIIPKLVTNPIGIIAEIIDDTIQKQISLNHEGITGKGIVGSSIINDKIVLLLNVYELFELADPDNYKTAQIHENKKFKILVVEDTPFFQKIEKDYLEEA